MGILKLLREGTWWLHSDSDSRWNTRGDSLVGGLVEPKEIRPAIEAKKKELGEEPPKDLEWGYCKF